MKKSKRGKLNLKKRTINKPSKINQTAWVVSKRSLKSNVVKNKRVIIRCDYNVPIKNGIIGDETRIVASLKTISFCLNHGAKQLILISHLGRPKAKNKEDSLEPVAKRLSELLKQEVLLAPSCTYSDFVALQDSKNKKRVVLLENVRFHPQEEKNDVAFAKQLALFGDIYVNDAFGTAHRGHASNSAITKFLPSYIGFLMQNELAMLNLVTNKPKRPLVVLLGFAKITDKIHALTHLLTQADKVLLGGAVAFTFLLSQGKEVGLSKVELEQVKLASKLLRKYPKKIALPVDVVCATNLDDKHQLCVSIDDIPNHLAGYDIGTRSIKLFREHLQNAKTVFWNGPVGVFEHTPYDVATNELAKVLADLTKRKGLISIVGGGDTASAAVHAGVANNLTHISTGGGASLEFMEGSPLPAINAIFKASSSK